MTTTPECLQQGPDCDGDVEFHSMRPGQDRGFPRCEKHWFARLDARENSMEQFADSDVTPQWFDPSYAGETW